MCCTWLAGNAGLKNSPSGHHRTLSGCIFTTEACIDNWKKNLLNSNISPTCPHNMANFGPLANFNGFHVLAALLTARHCSSERQSNIAALNRGRHLYSTGRPSGWALAHISSSILFSSPNLSGRKLDVYHTSTHGVALV